MTVMPRRGGEFVQLGAIGLHAAGVPARRAHEIEIERAWHAVAGAALARRVRLIELRRGVLWLEAADRSWLTGVRPHMPRIARELARRFPKLGIKKLRLRLPGTDRETAFEVDVRDERAPQSGEQP